MSSTKPDNDASPASANPLQSTLASDPDMLELVAYFVDEMSSRVQTISTAAQDNDLGQLRTVAHQLKGAAAGYGFAPISDCASQLEQLIDAADPAQEVETMRGQVDELIELCRRVSL